MAVTPSQQDVERAITEINELLAKDPTVNTNNITGKELSFGDARVKLSRTTTTPPTITVDAFNIVQATPPGEKKDEAKNKTTDNKNQP